MWIIGCVIVILSIFLGDLFLKNYIERTGEEEHSRKLWGGKLLIRKYHNRGAMLNLGQKKRRAVAAVSVLMTVAVLAVFLLSLGQRGNGFLKIGLSFILGGAFSNTYDRLRRKYVVDYLSFGVRWRRLRRIVFNLSDFCIIIGAMLAAVGALRMP